MTAFTSPGIVFFVLIMNKIARTFILRSKTFLVILALALLLPSTILRSKTSLLAQAPASNPQLKVVTPSQDQTIYGDRIPILLSPENFQIVDYQKNPLPQKDQGHIHLWLDEQNPTRESAIKLTTDSFTYTDVNFGTHSLRAELVANNHTSLAPPVVVTVNFRSIPITPPLPAAASGFDKNTALVILVVVALVIVAAWWYTKEEEEEPKLTTSTKKRPTKIKTASKSRR